MSTTAPSSRTRSPGSRERHRAHMEEIRALRAAAVHQYTPTKEEEIALSDKKAATEISMDERLDKIEASVQDIGDSVRDGLEKVTSVASEIKETVERMKTTRFALDQQTINQLGATLRAEFARTSKELVEAHAAAVSERVGAAVAGDFLARTKKAIQETVPADSPLGKLAAVMAILGGVVITGMACTYGYAVFNYKPPITTVEVDGATGEASARATGGGAL